MEIGSLPIEMFSLPQQCQTERRWYRHLSFGLVRLVPRPFYRRTACGNNIVEQGSFELIRDQEPGYG